jgi:uncharacterized protein (DUF2141 family)
MRTGYLRPVLLLLLAACATAGVTSLVRRDGGPDALVVVVEKVRNADGDILVSVFENASGFPNDPEKALHTARVSAVTPSTTVEIEGVAAGRVAVAVLHDENGNGSMETDWLGRPTEGWAVSNDARGRFGPPSYDDAIVELSGGRATIHVNMSY